MEIQARLRAGQPLAHVRTVAAYRGWSADDFTAARDWAQPDAETVKHWNNGRKPHPREHGTPRGYYQHRRNEEEPCAPCRDARRAADRERKAS
jgi:hypothetical protein